MNIEHLEYLIMNYDNYGIKQPILISKNIKDNVVIWSSTLNWLNYINITSIEEYEEERKKQTYDYRISSDSVIFKTQDSNLVLKIKNIISSNSDYKKLLQELVNEIKLQKKNDYENANIKYLRQLLKDYEDYNVTKYISVSSFAQMEKNKVYPSIIIWEDLEGIINVNAKSEYNLLMKVYGDKYSNFKPKLLFEINDKDKILELIEILTSYRNYDDKLSSLIYILDENKKLQLK